MFSDKLKELRQTKGITQKQLADMAGFGRSRISNYENGIRTPDWKAQKKLANFFNISLDCLMDRDVPQSEIDTANSLTEQEKALLAFYRSASEENKLKIIQFIMNNTNGSS